jgi:putative MFS transporter
MGEQYLYEDAPLRLFHLRIAAAATGGVFSDGFGLGIIGIALSAATVPLDLSPLWLGLLGGSSLAGLFIGALLTGPVADRFGRRPIFAYNMALLAACALLQFFVSSAAELAIIRLAIGILLGTDYVVSKALLTEFTPRRLRGRILGTLAIAWASGYVCAYFIGYALSDSGPEAWRWMLLTSAVPALLVLPLRLRMPESPLWLTDHGDVQQAAQVVRATLGADIAPPARSASPAAGRLRWQQLFTPAYRRRTLVACTFFTCQVIPYFAIGTFIAKVMAALNVQGTYLGGLVYNALLLVGAVLGVLIVDHTSRRGFLIGSFVITTGSMLILSLWPHLSTPVVILLFAAFAGTLSASQNLVYVYLPELFPTELRASGIGVAIAASRIGSAVSTFLLPVLVADVGVRAALAACAGVLGIGGTVCAIFAPETKNLRLNESKARQST